MATDGSYPHTNQARSIAAIQNSENRVTLDDGSIWQVYEGFDPMMVSWAEGEMVNVKPSRDPKFPYKLVNIHRNESVEARWIHCRLETNTG